LIIISPAFAADNPLAPQKPLSKDSVPGDAPQSGGTPVSSPEPQTYIPDTSDDYALPKPARVILLYIPNIIMDTLDLVSFRIGFGSDFALQAKITNYFQFGWDFGDNFFVGKHFHRQIGMGKTTGSEYGVFCLSREKRKVERIFGTIEPYSIQQSDFTVQSANDYIYRNKKEDFNEIGAIAGWPFVIGLWVHPVEFSDLIAAFFCVDLMEDNICDSAVASFRQ
jgi:hypothetical protein